MSIITENAKQIRNPMTVKLSIDEPPASSMQLQVTPSGAFIADTWNNTGADMYKLADLQNGGFPLDGTHVLYEANMMTSSLKIGERSNVGQPLQFRIRYAGLAALTFKVTRGKEIITSETESYDDNSPRYPVASTNIIKTDTSSGWHYLYVWIMPESSIERAELNYIEAGLHLDISNDEILSCEVNLRVDLSDEATTLPESEITVEMYYPYDVGEILANLSADTAIIYSAGYSDDMSTNRLFFLSENPTQERKIITFQAVDQVEKLDKAIVPYATPSQVDEQTQLDTFMNQQIVSAGIQNYTHETPSSGSGHNTYLAFEGASIRETLAYLFKVYYGEDEDIWYSPLYVDAGRPRFTTDFRAGTQIIWHVWEEDCADVKREYIRDIGAILYYQRAFRTNNFTEARECEVGEIVEFNPGEYSYYAAVEPQALQVITSNALQVVGKALGAVPLNRGTALVTTDASINQKTHTTGTPGRTIDIQEHPVEGLTYAKIPESILAHGKEYIQFTWKGHPEMQPMDTLVFHPLKGTRVLYYIETITIRHENGGTISEIRARIQ